MYNRQALKQRAKRLIGWGNPAMFLITLVYVLATTWVSSLSSLTVPNPLNSVSEIYMNWYNGLMDAMQSSGMVSQGTIDALTQRILSCFVGPQAAIGLLVALLVGFYSFVVGLGYCSVNLRAMRGQETGGYKELFSHFDIAAKIILMELLKVIFISLWSFLFVFPGIIAAYRYRLAEYCLLDDPDISALEAIRRSKRLMFGRKMDLFFTDFSFLGWMLLQNILVNAVASGVYALAGDGVLYTVVTLAATTACAMFLTTYTSLTEAGFYLFVLGNQAPPVQPGGFSGNGFNGGGFNNGQNGGFDPWGGTQNDGRNPWNGSDQNDGGNPWNGSGQNDGQNPWGGNDRPGSDDGNEGWNQ